MPSRLVGPTRGIVGAAVAFALLELVTRAELVSPEYLPPASAVLAATVGILADPEFLANVGGTLAAWVLGMVLATAIAVPFGLLLGASGRTFAATAAAIEFLRPIPSVALIPLAILLLGRGIDMKVALVVYASMWPILLNTIYGIHGVDPVARDTARAFGYGRVAVLRRVSLPSAAPFIYTGVRIASAIALIVAISAELIAGGELGIGTWMLARTVSGVDRELVYAAIVVTGILGLAINGVLVAGERRLFAWHPRVRGAE